MAIAPLMADAPPSLEVGARVRVCIREAESEREQSVKTTPKRKTCHEGKVLEIRSGEIVLTTDAGESISVNTSSAEQLEVSTGTRGHARKGMLIGCSAALVAVLAANYGRSEGPCDYGLCVFAPAIGAAVGGAVGLGMRSDRWTPISPGTSAIALWPTSGGIQIVFTKRF